MSARGSKNLPILVTSCHFLAKYPSRKSLKEATMKMIAAISCSIRISNPPKIDTLPNPKFTRANNMKSDYSENRNLIWNIHVKASFLNLSLIL